MKYLTTALFLGVISTKDVSELRDAINALKISVSKEGQQKIDAAGNKVGKVWGAIEHSQPVRNLGSSLKRWAESKEAMNIKKIDKAFLASPEGKRLVAEWKDVGRVLEKNVYENDTGIHIPNSAMNEISDEMDDVADQYKSTFAEGKPWRKAYDAGWKAALENKQAQSVYRRADAFEHSKEGKVFGASLKNLDRTLKENVKVSDVPDDWKTTNQLKIEISKAGQQAIEEEANDVGEAWKKIENSRVVRNLGSSLDRWDHSPEMQHIHELDKAFLASPEGKRLVAEWKDFGHALEKNVYENDTGIHIPNSAMDEITDEADDVADQYQSTFAEGKPWRKAYDAGWKAALTNKQAEAVGRRFDTFKHSDEGHYLGKELKELDMTIKKNVKVSDVPEDWKTTNNLKVTVHNSKAIENEWDDVEDVWMKIRKSRPVRNLGSSVKRWAHSDEVEEYKALEDKFLATPRGQRMKAEWTDVFHQLDKSVYHNKNGLYIDNNEMDKLSDELDDVGDQYDSLAKTHWWGDFKRAEHAAFTNKEAGAVKRRAEAFKHSPQGHALKKEVQEFKHTVKENVEVSDIPESWKKGEMFLF